MDDEAGGWLWSPVAEGDYRRAVPPIVGAAAALGVLLGSIVVLASAWYCLVCLDLAFCTCHTPQPKWASLLMFGVPHLLAGAAAVRCSLSLSTRGSWVPAAIVAGLSALFGLESVVGLGSHVYHDVLRGQEPHVPWVWVACIVLCAASGLVSFQAWPSCWLLDREWLEQNS